MADQDGIILPHNNVKRGFEMERETIVFENTWANVAPMLAELLINGSHHAQNFAREELATMARAADAWVQHLKNHGQALGHDD